MSRVMICVILSVCVGPVAAGSAAQSPDRKPPIPVVVAPEALPKVLADGIRAGGIRILDARSKSAYQAGHLEGAVRVDVPAWKGASLEDGGLTKPQPWRARFAKLGVGRTDRVIVYDDGRMTDASRVWFLLQTFGVRNASVLDGGFPELEPLIRKRTLVVSKKIPSTRPASKTARPTADKPRAGLALEKGVARASERRTAVILDVRTEPEFAGTDNRPNPRHGHIPHAINLPHVKLFDTTRGPRPSAFRGRLKSPRDLRKLFDQAGVPRDKPVIAHCQTGGRSSLGVLALIHAGYTDVANYYRSFGEWSADPKAPLVQHTPSGE